MTLLAVTAPALFADALVGSEDHLAGDVAHRPALPVREVQPLRPAVLVDRTAREVRPRGEELIEGFRDGRAVGARRLVGIDPPRHLGEPGQRLTPRLSGVYGPYLPMVTRTVRRFTCPSTKKTLDLVPTRRPKPVEVVVAVEHLAAGRQRQGVDGALGQA